VVDVGNFPHVTDQDFCSDAFSLAKSASERDVIFVEVDADDLEPALRQLDDVSPRTATEVEDSCSLFEVEL